MHGMTADLVFRCRVDSPMYAVGVVVTTPGGLATRRRPQLRGGVMAAADLTDWNCVTFYCTQLSLSPFIHASIIARFDLSFGYLY